MLRLQRDALSSAPSGCGGLEQLVEHRRCDPLADAVVRHLLEVDVDRPVEVGGVPGERLALLVEREQVLRSSAYCQSKVLAKLDGTFSNGPPLGSGTGFFCSYFIGVTSGRGFVAVVYCPGTTRSCNAGAASRYGMMTQSTA